MWRYHSETTVAPVGAPADQSLAALCPTAVGYGGSAEAQFLIDVTGASSCTHHLAGKTGWTIPAGQQREVGPFLWGRSSDSMGLILVPDGGTAVIHTYLRGNP